MHRKILLELTAQEVHRPCSNTWNDNMHKEEGRLIRRI
jgi:hypothetical protein